MPPKWVVTRDTEGQGQVWGWVEGVKQGCGQEDEQGDAGSFATDSFEVEDISPPLSQEFEEGFVEALSDRAAGSIADSAMPEVAAAKAAGHRMGPVSECKSAVNSMYKAVKNFQRVFIYI
ncbi:hypothetical protein XENOCAPTIV_010974 [Xenoophorus captivus]|uniref:Uncharacterized protein n=1 Tax=Xenoophorus captivus TaxID=1517983 RepID=A0ABV0RI26_9TELE